MQIQDKIELLFSEQLTNWYDLIAATEQVENAQVKKFNWGDDIQVNVQLNTARKISSLAKTDPKSIQARKCFLCENNRPIIQTGIDILEKYVILTNPFPILRRHLTIPMHSHVPQRIRKKIGDMLAIAELLPNYVVFYNGPKCGASAPDHFHFQAGLKMPILMTGENELRSCLVIESSSIQEIEERFEDVYQYLHKRQPDEDEPMLNAIAFTEGNKYVLHIFPRKSHRPKQFFEEGKRQLLISPGALDMAGLIIAVRDEDFDKIRKEDIEDIYSQVSMPVI